MPELPEVETIAQDLKKQLVGWTITNLWSDWPQYFKLSGGFDRASRALIGHKILNVDRRGKNILFDLSCEYTLAIHPKMSGCFLLSPLPRPSHTHLTFGLKKGLLKATLYFSDARKFGRILFGQHDKIISGPEIGKLGPDPLEISASDFLAAVKKRRGRIKTLLMNQSFLAGVGNIYSDEALYLARIHPLSRVERIPPSKLKELFSKLVFVLKKSIRLRGASRRDYRDTSGRRGDYFNHRLVYARKGEECSCGGAIDTVKIGGRTAHFCPKCAMFY